MLYYILFPKKILSLIDFYNHNQQVTPQSPEFIPTRISSSPNFYSPYHTPMLNGNVNGLTPTTTTSAVVAAKSVNGTGTPSMLGLQKATAAAVAQQKQLQQQQQQQQNKHSLVNGGTKQIVASSANQGGYVGMTTTPLKGGRNSLLRNESPSSIGEKSPPRMTPHASPIPTTLPANVHQVSSLIFYKVKNKF